MRLMILSPLAPPLLLKIFFSAPRSELCILHAQVLCSVSDPATALSEMRHVLKPGGRLLFIEHVLAPESGLTRISQNLLDPLQQLIADGCHLTRDTYSSIKFAGFDIDKVESCRFDVRELGILGPHIAGVVGLSKNITVVEDIVGVTL
jgi:SAM-dependent methyltransferase